MAKFRTKFAYISPEYVEFIRQDLRKEDIRIDQVWKSDIFSLGLCLLEVNQRIMFLKCRHIAFSNL